MTASLRDRTAAVLDALCADGRLLAINGAASTWRLHGRNRTPHNTVYDYSRAQVQAEIAERYLDDHHGPVVRDGRAVIVTAGAPASGKSTLVDGIDDRDHWRRIDPDRIKELLVEHDVIDPTTRRQIYRDMLVHRLPDKGPVHPMELAGLFHHESVQIADRIAARCRQDGENLIIEGTLQWLETPRDLTADYADYDSLRVALAERPLDDVLESALDRWWQKRLEGNPGGRFVPSKAIKDLYKFDPAEVPDAEPSDLTLCAGRARELVRRAQDAGLDADFLT